MSWTILVIDDDEKRNRLLKRYLKDFGFEVYSAADADEGLKKARTVLPDLIILYVMLPGTPARCWTGMKSSRPFAVLTASIPTVWWTLP